MTLFQDDVFHRLNLKNADKRTKIRSFSQNNVRCVILFTGSLKLRTKRHNIVSEFHESTCRCPTFKNLPPGIHAVVLIIFANSFFPNGQMKVIHQISKKYEMISVRLFYLIIPRNVKWCQIQTSTTSANQQFCQSLSS